MIGRQLGHFEVLDEIGAGAMGTVYRARDLDLHRTVALKVLPPATRDDERRRRFLGEARAASALNHPSIVTIHEVGSDDEVDFIAMELVDGESLDRILEQGPLPEDRILRIARAMAEALRVAHARGIVHRDLKPANVMIGDGDAVKILDFGLAKRVVAGEGSGDHPTIAEPVRTEPGMILGTPAYMAPEQARGERIDGRTDLFALGCMLYEMSTGERPFSGRSPLDVLSAILTEEPPPPSSRRAELPKVWDRIVGRLLAKRPDDRLASADLLLSELATLEKEATGSGSAAASTTRPRPLLVALAVLAVLGLAALLLRGDGEADAPAEAAAGDAFPEFRFRLLADLPGSQTFPRFSPDARKVAFTMEDEAGVKQAWVMELEGLRPVPITEGDRDVTGLDWAPSDDRIVFSRSGDGIWEVPPLGGAARQLLEFGAGPRLSRDGGLLAFNHSADGRLWLAGGDGSDPRPLPGFEPVHFGLFARGSFSPDGSRIALFVPQRHVPLGDVWVASVEGGEPRRLTDLGFLSWGTIPEWSSDGRWILFSSDHNGTSNLWRVGVEDGALHPVTAGAGSDLSFDLSVDDRLLAYSNGRIYGSIVLRDPDGSDPRTVHRRRDQLNAFRLSPDGRRAAYFSRSPGAIDLFVVDLETGEERQVTRGKGWINVHPVWAPDGESLYYYRQPLDDTSKSSWREISVEGTGDREVFDDWWWTVQHQTSPSPDEGRVVYLLKDGRRNVETRLRDLATGKERTLPRPLFDPRWTGDGRKIVGADSETGRILLCPVDASECRDLAAGWWAILSPDESVLHVLRDVPPVVWRVDLATGEETRLFPVEAYVGVGFGWGVRPNGEVAVQRPRQESDVFELWIGEAIDDAP